MMSFLSTTTRFMVSSRVVLATSLLASTATIAYYAASTRTIASDSGKKNIFPSYLFGNRLKLASISQESPDTKYFKFRLPDHSITGVQPGKAVLAFVNDNESGKLKVRPYSLLYIPDEKEFLHLAVKLLNGDGTSGAFHRLKVGDEVTFRGPLPIHTIDYQKLSKNVNFIAGGSGITPVFSTIQNILLNHDQNVSLIYANKDQNDIPLKSKIDQLKRKYGDRFQLNYVVDKQHNFENFVSQGRINPSLLKQHLYSKDAQLFVCGPDGLTKAIKQKYLKEAELNMKLYKF